MLNVVLEKEMESPPNAAINEVLDFIRFVKLKFFVEDTLSAKKSLYGIWKNELFYMSPNFD